MRASISDLRHRMKDVLKALERNEPVTILYRGKERGILMPMEAQGGKPVRVEEHPAFGMWRDHAEKKDVAAYDRSLRKGRTGASWL